MKYWRANRLHQCPVLGIAQKIQLVILVWTRLRGDLPYIALPSALAITFVVCKSRKTATQIQVKVFKQVVGFFKIDSCTGSRCFIIAENTIGEIAFQNVVDAGMQHDCSAICSFVVSENCIVRV